MNDEQREKIAICVIKILYKRFNDFPSDSLGNRNAPFHEAFLRAFQNKLEENVSNIPIFVSLSSWMHGLNTTLGQTFFEHVAHILSYGEKREYTSKKLGNLKIPKSKKNKINDIMTQLSNSNRNPNLNEEERDIESVSCNDLENVIDFSADVYIEEEDSIIAIEMKSVKPNSGEMKGEKQKILEGKTALKFNNPEKDVKFYIGFPFDPTSDESVSYDQDRFLDSIINMKKYFDGSETLVAKDLWNFLSSEQNTMEKILEIINSISTPKFEEKYNFINDPKNRNNNCYLNYLREWYLGREIQVIENMTNITTNISDNRKLIRVLNQQLFDKDGVYKSERAEKLLALI